MRKSMLAGALSLGVATWVAVIALAIWLSSCAPAQHETAPAIAGTYCEPSGRWFFRDDGTLHYDGESGLRDATWSVYAEDILEVRWSTGVVDWVDFAVREDGGLTLHGFRCGGVSDAEPVDTLQGIPARRRQAVVAIHHVSRRSESAGMHAHSRAGGIRLRTRRGDSRRKQALGGLVTIAIKERAPSAIPFTVRPYDRDTEQAFVGATWSRSFMSTHWAQAIPQESYFEGMASVIESATRRGIVLVAEHDVHKNLLGHVVGERRFGVPVIHWVHVKKDFWRNGVANALVDALLARIKRPGDKAVYYTHQKMPQAKIAQGRGYVFNPFLAHMRDKQDV